MSICARVASNGWHGGGGKGRAGMASGRPPPEGIIGPRQTGEAIRLPLHAAAKRVSHAAQGLLAHAALAWPKSSTHGPSSARSSLRLRHVERNFCTQHTCKADSVTAEGKQRARKDLMPLQRHALERLGRRRLQHSCRSLRRGHLLRTQSRGQQQTCSRNEGGRAVIASRGRSAFVFAASQVGARCR